MSSYEFQDQRFSAFNFRIGHEQITLSVQRLILANAVVFAVQLIVEIPLGTTFSADWLGFNPLAMQDGYVWQPFTYMFLHSGLSHLFFNMLMLYFFGPDVERLLGTRQFLRFYILCGALGVMANYVSAVLPDGTLNVTVIGASGATLGVLVGFAIAEPNRKLFLFPLPVPISARWLIIIILMMNLLQAMQVGSSTSVATHFGGMATAYVFMKLRPKFTAWQLKRPTRSAKRKGGPTPKDLEKLGKEIDNILKFGKQDSDQS